MKTIMQWLILVQVVSFMESDYTRQKLSRPKFIFKLLGINIEFNRAVVQSCLGVAVSGTHMWHRETKKINTWVGLSKSPHHVVLDRRNKTSHVSKSGPHPSIYH